MFYFSLSVLFPLLKLAVAAHPCSDVRIEALQYLPVPHQGNVNTCYAYVGAQLVDLWRFSHTPEQGGDTGYKHLTSGLAAVLDQRAADAAGEESIDWGRACEVVDEVRQHGSCDTRAVADPFKDTHLREKLNTLNALYASFKPASSADRQLVLEKLDRYLRDELKIADFFMPRPSELEKLLGSERLMGFLAGIVAPACTDAHRVHPRVPECRSRRQVAEGVQYYEKVIHGALDRSGGPQAVGVSLCSQVLKKGRAFVGVTDGKSNKDCGKHVVLVVGRRQYRTGNGSKCQFLVRNSWGATYARYSSDWQTDSGNVWVDADALTANTYGVAWLE